MFENADLPTTGRLVARGDGARGISATARRQLANRIAAELRPVAQIPASRRQLQHDVRLQKGLLRTREMARLLESRRPRRHPRARLGTPRSRQRPLVWRRRHVHGHAHTARPRRRGCSPPPVKPQDHRDVHTSTARLAALQSHFTHHYLAGRHTSHCELAPAVTAEHEQSLIDAGTIQATGFNFVGEPNDRCGEFEPKRPRVRIVVRKTSNRPCQSQTQARHTNSPHGPWPNPWPIQKAPSRRRRPSCRGSQNAAQSRKPRWRDPDSNRGHHDFQSCALPTELSRRARPRVAPAAEPAVPRGVVQYRQTARWRIGRSARTAVSAQPVRGGCAVCGAGLDLLALGHRPEPATA